MGSSSWPASDEHPDLFWGLRGGGGNFGVVTSFQYRLHSVGPTVLAGVLAWPMAEAADVLRFFRDFVAAAPDEVGIMANLRLAPALPTFPVKLHGRPVVALIIFTPGPSTRGKRCCGRCGSSRHPSSTGLGPKPYASHQAVFDPAYPHGRGYYWKAWKLPPLTDRGDRRHRRAGRGHHVSALGDPDLHPGRGRRRGRRRCQRLHRA